MKVYPFPLVNIKVISILLLTAAPLTRSAQAFSKKDLIGKWQSVNAEKSMEMIFADTTTLYIKTDGNAALNNTTLTYSIDSIENHALLHIRFPNGFTMKMIIWVKGKDEIRLFAVEPLNYKDPLKDVPEEGSKQIVIMKRSKNVI